MWKKPNRHRKCRVQAISLSVESCILRLLEVLRKEASSQTHNGRHVDVPMSSLAMQCKFGPLRTKWAICGSGAGQLIRATTDMACVFLMGLSHTTHPLRKRTDPLMFAVKSQGYSPEGCLSVIGMTISYADTIEELIGPIGEKCLRLTRYPTSGSVEHTTEEMIVLDSKRKLGPDTVYVENHLGKTVQRFTTDVDASTATYAVRNTRSLPIV